MKSIETICTAGKAVGKKWMARSNVLKPAAGEAADRLACRQFEVGRKVAIKLNFLNYAAC